VAKRKAFLLRVDPAVLDALQRWADDDLRSLNGQIEFVLRRGLKQAGRTVKSDDSGPGEDEDGDAATDGKSKGHPGA
jgi:hypothetical protein